MTLMRDDKYRVRMVMTNYVMSTKQLQYIDKVLEVYHFLLGEFFDFCCAVYV